MPKTPGIPAYPHSRVSSRGYFARSHSPAVATKYLANDAVEVYNNSGYSVSSHANDICRQPLPVPVTFRVHVKVSEGFAHE